MENLQNKSGLNVIALLAVFLAGGLTCIQLSFAADEPAEEKIAAIISCKGLIDDGLFQSIKRRSQRALDEGASHLIYEIGTYGGLLKSGDDISKYFILDIGKKAHTVAYITTEAISAGAMISVGCKDIIMLENTTIGDCAPIILGGKLEGVEREKSESFTRAAFMRAAEANNYPAPLLKAMVTQQIEVFAVVNNDTGQKEFFETKDLPTDDKIYDIENKKLVVKDDELLTLTASQALEYGIARTTVKDRGGALAFLEQRDNIKFASAPLEFEPLWSEQMVRWLNSPAVVAVLAALAMLGVYVELNTPGLGLPGLLAVVCLVILVGSKYLIGMANWVEVAIFCLGIILLMIELFVIPGFGIAGFAGIACVLVGIFGMLIKNPPDSIPWPKPEYGGWDLFIEGLLGITFGLIGFTVLAVLFARFLPKMAFLSGLILKPIYTAEDIKHPASITAPPETKINLTVGQTGNVITPLRPTGTAKFDDAIVDVVARAQFLETGDNIEIVEAHGNRIVVKKI